MTSPQEQQDKIQSTQSSRDRGKVRHAVRVIGFTLLGAAVAVPAILLYLGKRLREEATSAPAAKPSTPQPTGDPSPAQHHFRIPITGESPTAQPTYDRSADDSSATEPPAPVASVSSVATEIQQSHYVGSTGSNKVHHPSCRWARQIQEENRRSFRDLQTAKAQGYVPCSVCIT